MTGLSSAALLQQRLWSTDPEGWALYSEPHNRALFAAVLAAGEIGQGTSLLDVGCGTGLLLAMASERGAAVTGIDVSPGMLAVAARAAPSAELVLGDLQRLPFDDSSFDVVTGVNSFAFAEDPRIAFTEAARVLVAGGRVVVGMFAEPERSESTAIHIAMSSVSPPQRDTEHAPYALSEHGNLEAAICAAGLTLQSQGEVELDWHYLEVEHAVRGLSTSGGGTRAAEDIGMQAVEQVVRTALIPFTDPATGAVTMRNTFRWLAAIKD